MPDQYAIGYKHEEYGFTTVSRRRRMIASIAGTRARPGGRLWDSEMEDPWLTPSPRQAYKASEKLDEEFDADHHVIHVEEVRDDGAVLGKVWDPEEVS